MKESVIIVIALLLVSVPIMFVWVNELGDINQTLTNGFAIFDSSQSYHFWMYVMFAVNFIGAYMLLKKYRVK